MDRVNAEPTDITKTTIKLNWAPLEDTGGVEVENYEIQWRLCGEAAWLARQMVEVTATEYTH